MSNQSFVLTFFIYLFILPVSSQAQNAIAPWQEGMMDIHHINTGRGNAAFLVLPDGTTLLIDAGELNKPDFEKKNFPLKSAPVLPDAILSAGKAIVNYIRQVAPFPDHVVLNYALITHFHEDHYGAITAASLLSATKKYKLAGITEVGELLPIEVLMDRDYPTYKLGTDLRTYYGQQSPSFNNYLDFINYRTAHTKMMVTRMQAGKLNQIALKRMPLHYTNFTIRNIKVNHEVWSGQGDSVRALFSPDSMYTKAKGFNENPLSSAIKISYGNFDYYTGGDNTGLQGFGLPTWFDVETPMATAIGKVEAMSLNHHGNRDASNDYFLKTLAPDVVVAQSWCSDQPGQEVAHRLVSKHTGNQHDFFLLNMHEETQVTLGPWIANAVKSKAGHVMIRVMPGGNEYYVHVLNAHTSKSAVMETYGPYYSHAE